MSAPSHLRVPGKEEPFLRNSGGHGIIPWTKLSKKIYTAANKEEGVEWAEEPSIAQQQMQESALLNAYESPGAHF